MAIGLKPRAPKAPPKHLLSSEAPPKRERTTLMLIMVIVLASGAVVGTTATFNAVVTSKNNKFANYALRPPTAPDSPDVSTAYGDSMRVYWKAPDTYPGTGYKVMWRDNNNTLLSSGAVPSSPCTTTPTVAVASRPHNAGNNSWIDTDAPTRASGNYTDGRIWCYQVITAYPYETSPATTIPNNAWLSYNSTGSAVNGLTVTVVAGFALLQGTTTGGGTSGNGLIEVGTYFDFVFNQPIDQTAVPVAGTDTICTNGNTKSSPDTDINGGPAIYIGMRDYVGTGIDTCNPLTETLTGFRLVIGSGAQNRIRRYAISSVTFPTTSTMRITVGTQFGTSSAAQPGTGTLTAQGTANTTYLKTAATPARSYCASGVATVVYSGATISTRADPTSPSGRCRITMANTL